MAKLRRLSMATLTFVFFFYTTTLLTSYFYPLDWAPIAFKLAVGQSSSEGRGQLGFQEAPAPLCPFLKPTCTGDFLDYSESIRR
jgi:hypothetical protein